MKKTLSVLLALIMVFAMAACGQNNTPATNDVEMKYMSADETAAIVGTEGYTIIDLRKAADYEAGHIVGSISVDMDAAVNGDTAAGEAAMKAAVEGKSDTLVLVCYSGKKYAQAGTNALSALGYDMSKVFTLEGGFKGWTRTDLVDPQPLTQVTGTEMKYMTADELAAVLGTEGYMVIDLRKAADYEAGHITGSVLADMDKAKDGDFESGVANMKAVMDGSDDTLVLVCYSGKKYAQAGTDILASIGYDMSKVFTLEGGFNGWTAGPHADKVEK